MVTYDFQTIKIVDITLPTVDNLPNLKKVTYVKSSGEYKESYQSNAFMKKMYDKKLISIGDLYKFSEKEMITEEDGGMRAYPLFPFDPARNLEVFYIEFDAGVTHGSLPHVAGVEEYVLLV